MHSSGAEELLDGLESALNAVEGVHWAQANPLVARVVVAFDEESLNVDDLIEVVDAYEDANNISADDALVLDWDHPGEGVPLRWSVVELGADLTGIALGAAARAARLPRLPIQLTASLPAIDNVPPVRRYLEQRRPLEVGLISVSAVFQGLGHGPFGLIVDAAHRVMLVREAAARRSAWERLEPRLVPDVSHPRPASFDRTARPQPLPDGLVETYAQRVSIAALPAGAAAALLRGNLTTFADVVIGAVPRAARMGREGFATEVACGLSSVDVLVVDPAALRRLDRVDTVVVDAEVVTPRTDATDVLVASIREAAQDFVLHGATPHDRDRLDPDIITDGDLHAEVRRLQADGRVVAVVCGRADAGLTAADCGIGVILPDRHPPWGAHVVCPGPRAAARVIDATAEARLASRRAVDIAAAGAAVSTVLALGPASTAGRRAVLANSGAALVALGAGAWTAAFSHRPLPHDDEPQVEWHALGAGEVAASLDSGPEGLPRDAVQRRHEDNGIDPGRASIVTLLGQELANPLTVLLGAGGALSTATGSMTDGVMIAGVLGVNALIGAAQRVRTEQAIDRLGALVAQGLAHVRRDGTEQDLPPDGLVDGDLVLLRAGDVVPADARIVSASHLETDESALTGESLPVGKQEDPVAAQTPVAERRSMVYAGTAVAAGTGEAIVVATGRHSEARRGIADGGRPPASGVETRLESLTRASVPLVLAAGGVLTGSSLLRGVPVREAVATGTSLAAAAVPEGLPFLATVAQSAAARRLSRQGVLVRNPRVLEPLGRADVLCFDKTGTLTHGRLELRAVSDGEIVESVPSIDGRRRLVLAAALRATPKRHGRELPHPTDQVIADGADVVRLKRRLGAPGWRKAVSLPFASDRGYHAVLGETQAGKRLSVKGAPEVVLPRCTTWRRGNAVEELDGGARRRIEHHVETLAKQGLRVLAVAERPTSDHFQLDESHVNRLELAGFVTVADVARPSAVAPIAQLRDAGIRVVMLTGDHPGTAEAIASELGLLNGGVVSGPQLDALNDDQLEAIVDDATVFARVTPAHKVRIVEAFQRRGRVVAMTGDGANDAQAIRLADVGIAFGRRATPAAQAVADLVVVDEQLETVITAIVEGRALWASVRDALALLLGGNLGEIVFTTGAGLLTGRSPLNPRQLIAVNLLTDLAPAMAIALRSPLDDHVDLRREGPETSLGSALTRDIAVRAGATAGGAGLAWTVARFTGSPTRARTVALVALVGGQLGQTLMVGYRSPTVLASGLFSFGALAAIVQTPGVSQFFGCRPLGPIGWSIGTSAATVATIGAAVARSVMSHTEQAAS